MFWKRVKENRRHRIIAAVAFVVMVAVNALANILPLNGQTSGQVSDKYANLFAPIGFTFLIWSVIYLLLAAYTLFQLGYLREKKSKLKPELMNRVTTYYIASSLLNAAWIFAWHYEVFWLSVIIIFGMLYCLVRINTLLKVGKFAKDGGAKFTTRERLLVKAPFSIYFGWITVACIANVTTWLVSLKWDGWNWGADVWTVTMLIVGAIVALLTMFRFRDVLFGCVFLWAYLGILAKHLAGNGWHSEHPAVIGSAVSLIAVLLLYTAYLTYVEYDLPKRLV
jgi:hypothetical protein